MLKKNNTPIEDVMKIVAKENGFTYIPPEKRTPKRIVFEEDDSGNVVVSLKSRLGNKEVKTSQLTKAVKLATSDATKSQLKLTHKRKGKPRTQKSNGKHSTPAKNYG